MKTNSFSFLPLITKSNGVYAASVKRPWISSMRSIFMRKPDINVMWAGESIFNGRKNWSINNLGEYWQSITNDLVSSQSGFFKVKITYCSLKLVDIIIRQYDYCRSFAATSLRWSEFGKPSTCGLESRSQRRKNAPVFSTINIDPQSSGLMTYFR